MAIFTDRSSIRQRLHFDVAELDPVVFVMLETDIARLELWVAAIEDLGSIQRSHKVIAPDLYVVGVPLIRGRVHWG